ncbi:hypothetical protein AUJ14_06185 [Candidatus Micrarchaeota archaeon CG1_02_55_22]|nr:MAG: hypothetical protein AUJ14_06185 [Candidatus Micrarchaeota archaeon CG1_02_55_22]
MIDEPKVLSAPLRSVKFPQAEYVCKYPVKAPEVVLYTRETDFAGINPRVEPIKMLPAPTDKLPVTVALPCVNICPTTFNDTLGAVVPMPTRFKFESTNNVPPSTDKFVAGEAGLLHRTKPLPSTLAAKTIGDRLITNNATNKTVLFILFPPH